MGADVCPTVSQYASMVAPEAIAELINQHLLPPLSLQSPHERTLIDALFRSTCFSCLCSFFYCTLDVTIKRLHLVFLIIDAAQERKATGRECCGINSGEQRTGTIKPYATCNMIWHRCQFIWRASVC